ncbi:ornithine decarboxylase-like [Ixodes scapularis]|uniref:ornithine decarboxylase-like n=1 Tax=Ixodes scapularis TaxID=6945 RepID=UPI001C3921AC|nr:ornithine decarboxylase-like [Ixodes scapularis]
MARIMRNGLDGNFAVYVEMNALELARELVNQQETDEAFFICDLRDLEQKMKLWQQELPQVTPYYAVKVCSDPIILHTMISLGASFDCSNKRELKTVLDMGVTPDRIVYANTVKSTSHLKYASEHGVTLMTFDSAEELVKMDDKNARLLLRIVASEFGSRYTMNKKFGAYSYEIENILKVALKLGRNVVGVAFHVGCFYHHPDIFAHTIDHAKRVFDLGTKMGFRMNVLDIGGGFPGGVRKQDTLAKVCEAIRSTIDKHFPPSSGVKIIAEPGQFFVTAAYSLVVRVVGKRQREISIDGVVHSHVDVFINESTENCVSRYLYPFLDIQLHPLTPPFDRPRNVLTSLYGATCNPIDRMEERTLMFDVTVDEWLFMDNMGAYGLVRATGFNGSGFPLVKYITTADKKPPVQRIVDSMLMSGGYGQIEEAIMARHPRKHITVADAGGDEKGLES